MSPNNGKAGNANPNYQGVANQTYTAAEIANFVNSSGPNAISYAIQRNPTAVYNFIQHNYPSLMTRVKQGGEVTVPVMTTMHDLLEKQYNNLTTDAARVHLIKNLLLALPPAAQLQNWTTPGTPSKTTTYKGL